MENKNEKADRSHIIAIRGYGKVHVAPDVTRVELTLATLHDTYQEAYEQCKVDTERMTNLMTELNLSIQLPKTTRFDIEKKTSRLYDKHDNYIGDKFIGFRLVHCIRLDLGMDTKVLNAVVKGIGKNLKQAEIEISYTVKDPRPYEIKVLGRAVHDAKEKAEVMAQAAGCELGDCKYISYGQHEIHLMAQVRNIHESREADCCLAESLAITPEDLVAQDEVQVEWYLKQNHE